MPNAFDLGKYTTDYNPIAGGPFVSIQDVMASFGDVFQEIIQLLPQLLNLIEQLPAEFGQIITSLIGIVFPPDGSASPLLTGLQTAIGGLASGFAGGIGSGGFVDQLISLAITILPSIIGQLSTLLTNPGNLLSGFGIGVSILDQLISAVGGSGSGLGGFANLFGGLGSLQTLLTGFTGGVPLLNQLVGAGGGNSGATNILGEFGNLFGGLGSLTTLFTGFTAGTPILSQLVSAGGGTGNTITDFVNTFLGGGSGLPAIFTSGLDTSISLLSQLPSVLTWPLSALGLGTLPAGIGLGSLTQVPGLSGLLGGLDTSGATSLLTQLPSLLSLPLSAIPTLLTMLGGFATGIPLVGQLAQMFNLPSTATLSQLITAGTSLLSMFGTPNLLPSGTFNPIAAVQQFAQLVGVPAGLLSSTSIVPLHTLGGITANSGPQTNALQDADPGFNDPTRFTPGAAWSFDTTLDHTGVIGSGSAKFAANGIFGRMWSLPVSCKPNVNITMGSYAHWSGVSATAGNAIRVAAGSFDAADNLISVQVIAAVASPPASSSGYTGTDAITPATTLTANAAGWVYLSGQFTTPAGTDHVRLGMEVNSNVNTGAVNFDDNAIYLPGLVDATLLHNFSSMEAGVIPGGVLQGFQGLQDIFGSFGHLFDGLGTAFSQSSQSGLSFSNLFGLAQGSSQNSLNALSQGIINSNILNYRQNQPSAHGANLTTEAMIPLPHFGSAGTLSTLPVAAGTSLMQKFNPSAVSQKGFIEFMGSLPAATTGGVFMNILKWNGTSWDKTWSSADITTQIGTAMAGVIRVLIPSGSQPMMNAGEQYMIGLANNTASTLTVVGKDTGVLNNSNETVPNFGAARTLSTSGGATPTNVANSALAYSGKVPYFGVGILNVPANYVPPQRYAATVSGPFTFVIPVWARVAGAKLDCWVLGGGGGGQANYGTLTWWTGGNAAVWQNVRLVCGVDYPVGTTTLSGIVGAFGAGAGAYWNNGHAGGDSSLTWNDGTTNHTLTSTGGTGGGNSGTSGSNGRSPGDDAFEGVIEPGGAAVGGNAKGSAPGGGGGGAGPYQTGGDGADGIVVIWASQ